MIMEIIKKLRKMKWFYKSTPDEANSSHQGYFFCLIYHYISLLIIQQNIFEKSKVLLYNNT